MDNWKEYLGKNKKESPTLQYMECSGTYTMHVYYKVLDRPI